MTAVVEEELPLEEHRTELTGYCYRMLGSAFEADDAVQETMVRAWRKSDQFEGRSSLRSWLYQIATNVCLTMLDGKQRRARPMDLNSVSTASTPIGPRKPELPWLEPMPDNRAIPSNVDPAEAAVLRDTIRLAFVVALQYLPPRQRAVLILCEVLRWKADEVAVLLESSTASVNSALQRARATLEAHNIGEADTEPEDETQRVLIDKYADSFRRYDIDELVSLLHEDVVMSMPPHELWLQGSAEVAAWLTGQGAGCRGGRLVMAGRANGCAAFGQYRVDPNGGFVPWALAIIETSGNKVTGISSFLETPHFFPMFDLPDHLDE